MANTQHRHPRRWCRRPVAGAHAGAPRTQRDAVRALASAVRAWVQPLCRRHARAELREGKRRADRARSWPARPRALARDLSRHCRQRHARRRLRARPRRARPLRPHDGRPSAPVTGRAGRLEPALVDRFAGALYYAEEGHLSPEPALHFLLEQAQAAGAEVRLGEGEFPADADLVIDCRGLAAKAELAELCAACAASGSW